MDALSHNAQQCSGVQCTMGRLCYDNRSQWSRRDGPTYIRIIQVGNGISKTEGRERMGGLWGGSTTLTLELTILPSSPCAGGHLEHGDHSHRAGGHEPTLPRDVSNEGPAEDHTIGPTQTRITSQVVRVDPLHTYTYMLYMCILCTG